MAAVKLDEWTLAMWKQQLGTALRVIETVTEQSRKVHEHQLAAAVEAHASAMATRESLAKASQPAELWRLQSEWAAASLERSAAYWRRLAEIAAETQVGMTKCLCEPATAISLPAPGTELALFGMMDEAYKRLVDTTKHFYAAVPTAQRKAA